MAAMVSVFVAVVVVQLGSGSQRRFGHDEVCKVTNDDDGGRVQAQHVSMHCDGQNLIAQRAWTK